MPSYFTYNEDTKEVFCHPIKGHLVGYTVHLFESRKKYATQFLAQLKQL